MSFSERCRRVFEYLLDWIIARQARRKLSKRRIDPNSQCFACGHKQGQIAYDPATRYVIHTCNVCGALRAERPIVEATRWDFIGRDSEQSRKYEAEVRQRFEQSGVIKPKVAVQ